MMFFGQNMDQSLQLNPEDPDPEAKSFEKSLALKVFLKVI